jgi:hypothetical protein
MSLFNRLKFKSTKCHPNLFSGSAFGLTNMASYDVLIWRSSSKERVKSWMATFKQWTTSLRKLNTGTAHHSSVVEWYSVVCADWLVIADSVYFRSLFMWTAKCVKWPKFHYLNYAAISSEVCYKFVQWCLKGPYNLIIVWRLHLFPWIWEKSPFNINIFNEGLCFRYALL